MHKPLQNVYLDKDHATAIAENAQLVRDIDLLKKYYNDLLQIFNMTTAAFICTFCKNRQFVVTEHFQNVYLANLDKYDTVLNISGKNMIVSYEEVAKVKELNDVEEFKASPEDFELGEDNAG